MKAASPVLLPLLRSRSQGDIIAYLFLDPERDHTATEIAEHLGLSLPTVTREVSRLADAGLVRSTKRGNTRLLRVDTNNPVYRPLADLMAVTFGPLPVLKSLLEQVPGIEEAFIYGSWAARYTGQPGPVPGDIDLMVVGDGTGAALGEALEAAEATLRREVNHRRVSAAAWEANTGSLKSTILSRPTVKVIDRSTEVGTMHGSTPTTGAGGSEDERWDA